MSTTIQSIVSAMNYDSKNENNIRLYHGTTWMGGNIIPVKGFENNAISIWSCSDEKMVYFYELKRFCEAKCYDEDVENLKNNIGYILETANEAGQIQEAILDKPHDKTYVVEIILPPEVAKYINTDSSCENMKYTGAIQIEMELINEIIMQSKCTINLYSFPFYPKMSYFYIAGLIDNPYAKDYLEFYLPKGEYNVLEIIYKSERCWFYDDFISGQEPTLEGQFCKSDLSTIIVH